MDCKESLKVESSLEDTGAKGESFCDEWYSACTSQVYNIPTSRVSLCPCCNSELFPCSVCEDSLDGGPGCSWNTETSSCNHFNISAVTTSLDTN